MPFIAQRPVMRRSPDGGVSFPKSSRSGHRYEVAIKSALPNRPATVPTADVATGKGRLLVLDLDTGRVPPEEAADRAGYIARTADRIVQLIRECGGRCLVDVSPSGGRHVYVLWAHPVRFLELSNLARAFAVRFPAVDISPMLTPDGQIRAPGAPHKSSGGRLTGFMTLTCSVDEAEAICALPCKSTVWDALLVELAAELDVAISGSTGTAEVRHPNAPDAEPGVELDLDGQPYRPRLGGRDTLRSDLEETARTGRSDSSRYPSSSEARQAVLSSAAARGWRLHQVRERLAGRWKAIAGWWRDDALLQAEWTKAVAFTNRPDDLQRPGLQKQGNPVQSCNTSANYFTPPAPQGPSAAGAEAQSVSLDNVRSSRKLLWDVELYPKSWTLTAYQRIRTWQNAMLIIERLLELEWGERSLTYRAILRAIGAAAQMSGRTEIEFGTRQLAYMAAVDHTTVSRALHVLRDGPYPLIDHVRDAQGVRADTYQLVVPDAVAAQAARRTWRPGRIEAIHPAFRSFTRGAAFAYEALTSAETTVADLETAALLSRSTTYQALAELSAYGLAERGSDGGWRRGTADLDRIATRNGGRAQAEAQLAEHRADRAEWHTFLGIIALPPTGEESCRLLPLAPKWLVPPPRCAPLTEHDFALPADVYEAMTAHAPSGNFRLHDDVRAQIRADQTAVIEDERTPAQQAEYEAELQALAQEREPRQATRAGPSAAVGRPP